MVVLGLRVVPVAAVDHLVAFPVLGIDLIRDVVAAEEFVGPRAADENVGAHIATGEHVLATTALDDLGRLPAGEVVAPLTAEDGQGHRQGDGAAGADCVGTIAHLEDAGGEPSVDAGHGGRGTIPIGLAAVVGRCDAKAPSLLEHGVLVSPVIEVAEDEVVRLARLAFHGEVRSAPRRRGGPRGSGNEGGGAKRRREDQPTSECNAHVVLPELRGGGQAVGEPTVPDTSSVQRPCLYVAYPRSTPGGKHLT